MHRHHSLLFMTEPAEAWLNARGSNLLMDGPAKLTVMDWTWTLSSHLELSASICLCCSTVLVWTQQSSNNKTLSYSIRPISSISDRQKLFHFYFVIWSKTCAFLSHSQDCHGLPSDRMRFIIENNHNQGFPQGENKTVASDSYRSYNLHSGLHKLNLVRLFELLDRKTKDCFAKTCHTS